MPAGGRCQARRTSAARARPLPALHLPSGSQAGSALTAISLAAVMCRICSTDTTGSAPMPPARMVTKAGTDSSARCTMSSTALQHTVRASESVNAPSRLDKSGQRAVVEPDDRVGQVVVVQQDQVRLGDAGQFGHCGPRAGHVDLYPVRAHEGTRPPLPAPSAASERLYRPIAMWCGRSVGCSSGASCSTANSLKVPSAPSMNSLRSVFGPAVCSQAFAQSPRLRPELVSSAAQQVGQRGVGPAVLGEVGPDASEEVIPANVGD